MRRCQVVGTPKVNQYNKKDKTQIKVLQESRGGGLNTWISLSAIFNHDFAHVIVRCRRVFVCSSF